MERPLENDAGMGSMSDASSSGGASSGSSVPSERSIVGPDGRSASESWGDMSSGLIGVVERNPMIAAVTSLAVGLIVGMMVGASVARD